MKLYHPFNFVLFLLIATSCASCTAPRGPLVVTDPDPSIKIPAMAKAVRLHDRSAISQLIKDLDNDDAAVRLYAIHALHSLTGQNFGFSAYLDENQRGPAIAMWKRWLDGGTAAPNDTDTAAVE